MLPVGDSPTMRVAVLVAVAALITACSSPEPAATPSTPASTSTTTTAAPTALLPAWEKRLPAESPRGSCPTEAMFEASCLTAILDFQKTVKEIGEQADVLGSRYAKVEAETVAVNDAVDEWVNDCVTSQPNTSERIGCLTPWNTVLHGDEAILAEIYAVERP